MEMNVDLSQFILAISPGDCNMKIFRMRDRHHGTFHCIWICAGISFHLDTDTVRNSLDFIRKWERGTTFWCPSPAMFTHNNSISLHLGKYAANSNYGLTSVCNYFSYIQDRI